MIHTSQLSNETADEKINLHSNKQNLNNKKIYFNSDGTEIKIGYNDETGIGFIEIVSE